MERRAPGPGPCPLCPLLLLLPQLLGWPAPSSAASEYDDYSPNGTEELQATLQDGVCPRAVPAETTVRHNVTFLIIPEAFRQQLGRPATTLVLPAFYGLVFLVGLPANALALWVLATQVELLPSTVFLMNLAASDLLLVLLLPLKFSYYFMGNHWPFGEGMCRLSTAAFYGNMYRSVLLLTCISTDRYLGVAHPFFARSFRSVAFAAGTCGAVWLVAALFTLPLTLLQQSFPLLGTRQILCHDALPHEEDSRYYYYYFVVLVACGFLAPLLVMAATSGAVLWVLLSNRQKYATAIKLTTLMLATVVLFYTPSNVLLLLHYAHRCFRVRSTLYLAYMGSLALSACNSCVDPFIYYYASEEFRTKVRGRLFGHRKGSAVSLKTSKETLPAKNSHSLV